MKAKRPKIVISAVNLVEGGTLSILQDCLAYAAKELSERYIDALRTKPLPNPIYLTFFLVWIVSFVVVQSLLGKMLSSR